MDDAQLLALIEHLPRRRIGLLPTPLQDCPRLGERLGGVRLLVKRDDLTGPAFGGNKVRGLELIVGEALAQGADTLITWGMAKAPPNHCRLVAAAGAMAGMRCAIVLGGPFYSASAANAFLMRLAGADVRLSPQTETMALRETCLQIADELRAAGARPYLVDSQFCFYGGLAAIGNAACLVEIREQCRAAGYIPDVVYTCSEGGTQAGLLLGQRLLDADLRVVGIAPTVRGPERRRDIALWATDGARRLGVELQIAESEVVNDDRFAGAEDGGVSPECWDAIRVAAATEAIILDPIYTAKAMAGLAAHIQEGRIAPGQTVTFIHTGGTPAIFDHTH